MLRRAPEGTEIGYAIGPAHRGQGLAARAVRVMSAYAFEQLGTEQLILELEAENGASVAVATKAGFRLLDVPLITGEEKGRPYSLQTWLPAPDAPDQGRLSGALHPFPPVVPASGDAGGPTSAQTRVLEVQRRCGCWTPRFPAERRKVPHGFRIWSNTASVHHRLRVFPAGTRGNRRRHHSGRRAPSAHSGAQTVLPAASDPGKILELVNKARTEAGCEPLTVDPKIAAAAQEYANDTTTNHTGSDGSSVKDRLTKAGATFTTGSENIAWGSGDEKTHVDGWLNSAAHAGAIKNCNFKKTGVAVSGDRIVQVFTD